MEERDRALIGARGQLMSLFVQHQEAHWIYLVDKTSLPTD